MGGSNKIENIHKMQDKFEDPDLEELYEQHSVSCRRSQLFPCFLFAMFLYSVAQIGIHFYWWQNLQTSNSVYNLYLTYVSVVVILSILAMIFSAVEFLIPGKIGGRSKLGSMIPHFAVCIWSATIISSIVLRVDESVPLRLCLGWVILETFLILATVPVRRTVALIYTASLAILHIGAVLWKGRKQRYIGEQLATNLFLLLGTNVLGYLSLIGDEKKQRLAFQDLRKSVEVKDVMSVHAEEQQRLLLSVLPKHLAETMTQSSETSEGGGAGFKKIYMERHEPVSILFADIVGFTAMSAALGSASKLVQILDELFSMFDSLAEKHSQVRIKILGDCYYCICGAPEERADHAVLCIHMGLAVVEAIKYFQKRTNTNVDMRVGIHTGAVLAGILGQRQWQFDVYSKDVDLANLMESGGIPGKVHISDKTVAYLNGEFEVEPGFGDTREEGLRMAGIKTFFITKVLKPFQKPATKTNDNNQEVDLNDQDTAERYNRRIRTELLSHDGDREILKRTNRATLRFLDKSQESEFQNTKMKDGGDGIWGYVGCCCAITVFTGTSFCVISFNMIGLLTALSGVIILYLMGAGARKTGNLAKNIFALSALLLLTVTNLILMIPCIQAGYKVTDSHNETTFEETETDSWPSFGCTYPAYLIIYNGFFLLSITLFSNFYFWATSAISFMVLGAHVAILNLTDLKNAFRASEMFSFSYTEDLAPETFLWTLFAILFFCALTSLTRRLELSARIRFLCNFNLEHQRELAAAFRLKNELLMCNIMPQHVANHFLNSKKSEGLYSENYLEAGVIFAAMPNFRDFYTEDAVNNQGLECLRFLNEVISDYDALLDLPKFNEQIIKIKTIGSTYMAASGLNPQKQAQPDDTFKERWRHLSLLVEFALDMKRVLNQINEQSYNQFVLKVGICHGPITAGVIGNTKPAYDIWGNTANVSSRMYSTGKADKIQVTDETYKILRMYGYQFERRGMISVKGKGEILTYFLIGTGPELTEAQISQLDENDD